jgi:hypothetical protein
VPLAAAVKVALLPADADWFWGLLAIVGAMVDGGVAPFNVNVYPPVIRPLLSAATAVYTPAFPAATTKFTGTDVFVNELNPWPAKAPSGP